MTRLIRSPALHFLLIGTVLFVCQRLAFGTLESITPQLDRSAVVVTAEDIADMRKRFMESGSGEPTKAQYDYMIGRFVDEELFYREALSMGMDRGDTTVRNRLMEKMVYLGEASKDDDSDDVVERAIALGLSRADPMVRSTLVQKYRMLVRFAGLGAPSEEQLRGYYERNKQRYERPARASIVHVYFSRQERGAEQARADAERTLESLRGDGGPTPQDAIALGDVFLMGHEHRNQSRNGISRLFGQEFAQAVIGVDTAGWIGPVKSAFGHHVVFISDATADGILDFKSVRSQLLKALEDELREEQLREKLADLHETYEIEIQWGDLAPKDEG
jgi:hypothetical protein